MSRLQRTGDLMVRGATLDHDMLLEFKYLVRKVVYDLDSQRLGIIAARNKLFQHEAAGDTDHGCGIDLEVRSYDRIDWGDEDAEGVFDKSQHIRGNRSTQIRSMSDYEYK